MKFCAHCGNQLKDNDVFCDCCGIKCGYISQPVQKKTLPLNTGMLVWGIVNAVIGFPTLVPFVLGIIAIVFTVTAQDVPYSYKEKLKAAKILNIIATAFLAIPLIIIGTIILVVLFIYV